MFWSEEVLEIPLTVSESGFGSWDNHELFPLIQQQPPQPQPQNPVTSNSGSDGPNRVVSSVDERKQRRMISNRESARRSRVRKQRHLEDLRNQVNRLKTENQQVANRLGLISQHCLLVLRDNDRLRSESEILRHRLSEIHRILLLRQYQQLAFPAPSNTVEQIPSLIA